MGQQRFYSSLALETTLAASLSAVTAGTTGSVSLVSNSGYPTRFPASILVEWGTANQEVITLTQAATGSGPFVYTNSIRGDDGSTFGTTPAHSAGATVYHGVSQRDFAQVAPVYNVCDKKYGADPTGAADSTTSIQAAINDVDPTGGTVFFPVGTYKISSALTVNSAVTLCGSQFWASIINQTSTTANAVTITGSGIQNVVIQDLNIIGPGSGSGIGVYAAATVTTNPVLQLVLRNLYIETFGSHGVQVYVAIVTTIDNVQCYQCGGVGFYVTGYPAVPTVGTSVSLISCYANDCGLQGYLLQTLNYCSLIGCASDTNGIGYQIAGSQGVSLAGCGAEVTTAKNGLDGTSFKIMQDTSSEVSYGIVLSGCFVRANNAVGYWVTGSSKNITIIGGNELNGGSATASIKTDSGTMSTIIGYNVQTATALTTGTYNLINDGSTGATSFASSLSFQGGPSVFGGTGAPATGLGVVGDFYYNKTPGTNTRIYQKTGASTWAALTTG